MTEGFRRGVRLAIDWGDARIGVAACDSDGVLAYPLTTVRAGADEIAELMAVVAEYEPIEVLRRPATQLERWGGSGCGKGAGAGRTVGRRDGRTGPVGRRRLTTVTASQRLPRLGNEPRNSGG